VLVARAEEHLGSSIPGRTHMQHAQPVLLSHHLLAHAWPLTRDLERLRQWRSRANLSPYGAGALAGSSLGLDPQLVATELGFAGTTQNSIDGTSSRDVVAEFALYLVDDFNQPFSFRRRNSHLGHRRVWLHQTR
jgi:argininosuccinate lyase